jgi:subtilisin family serine protease
MRRALSLILTISFLSGHSFAQNKGELSKYEHSDAKTAGVLSCSAHIQAEFVPGQMIVQFTGSVTDRDKRGVEDALSLKLLKTMDGNMGLEVTDKQRLGALALYEVRENRAFTVESLQTLIRVAERYPEVRFAEPNWIYRTDGKVSDDDYYSRGLLWGMYSNDIPNPVGPSGTTNQYGSQAEKAWARDHVGTSEVYVAVVDSGIQADHQDLKGNVDIADSWDFYYNRAPIFDFAEFIHGTHVAGIIGARGGNQIGVAGMVWNVQLISAKFIGPDTIGNTWDAIEALKFITGIRLTQQKLIVVVNNSWSGYGFSRPLLRAIKAVAQAGMVIVASASNECNDNDLHPAFPASYDTRDVSDGTPGLSYNAVLSVAALDKNGELPPFSNFGKRSVHLAAPGVDIYSTSPIGVGQPDYQAKSGTSMAAAFVSGAVALYASSHPKASAKEIIDAILGSVIPTASLTNKTATGGRLNVSSF